MGEKTEHTKQGMLEKAAILTSLAFKLKARVGIPLILSNSLM